MAQPAPSSLWLLEAKSFAEEDRSAAARSVKYWLKPGTLVVGRQGADIVIEEDKSISRKHAELEMVPADQWQREEVGVPYVLLKDRSKYGTTVSPDGKFSQGFTQGPLPAEARVQHSWMLCFGFKSPFKLYHQDWMLFLSHEQREAAGAAAVAELEAAAAATGLPLTDKLPSHPGTRVLAVGAGPLRVDGTLLLALLRGLPVVGSQWLLEWQQQKVWCNRRPQEENYPVQLQYTSASGAVRVLPSLAPLLQAAAQQALQRRTLLWLVPARHDVALQEAAENLGAANTDAAASGRAAMAAAKSAGAVLVRGGEQDPVPAAYRQLPWTTPQLLLVGMLEGSLDAAIRQPVAAASPDTTPSTGRAGKGRGRGGKPTPGTGATAGRTRGKGAAVAERQEESGSETDVSEDLSHLRGTQRTLAVDIEPKQQRQRERQQQGQAAVAAAQPAQQQQQHEAAAPAPVAAKAAAAGAGRGRKRRQQEAEEADQEEEEQQQGGARTAAQPTPAKKRRQGADGGGRGGSAAAAAAAPAAAGVPASAESPQQAQQAPPPPRRELSPLPAEAGWHQTQHRQHTAQKPGRPEASREASPASPAVRGGRAAAAAKATVPGSAAKPRRGATGVAAAGGGGGRGRRSSAAVAAAAAEAEEEQQEGLAAVAAAEEAAEAGEEDGDSEDFPQEGGSVVTYQPLIISTLDPPPPASAVAAAGAGTAGRSRGRGHGRSSSSAGRGHDGYTGPNFKAFRKAGSGGGGVAVAAAPAAPVCLVAFDDEPYVGEAAVNVDAFLKAEADRRRRLQQADDLFSANVKARKAAALPDPDKDTPPKGRGRGTSKKATAAAAPGQQSMLNFLPSAGAAAAGGGRGRGRGRGKS